MTYRLVSPASKVKHSDKRSAKRSHTMDVAGPVLPSATAASAKANLTSPGSAESPKLGTSDADAAAIDSRKHIATRITPEAPAALLGDRVGIEHLADGPTHCGPSHDVLAQ